MRSTLFFIPVEVAGIPVLGLGWLLAAWVLVSFAILAWLVRQQGWTRDTASYLPFQLVVAAVIVFLLPNMIEVGTDGQPLGVPIRGFGVMLMLATVASVGLAAWRAHLMGLDPEVIYSLAFCMFIAGIVGARLFFILQYADQFVFKTADGAIDVPKSVMALFNVTKGGLVVYGSVIAGVPAGIWFLRRRGLPVLAMGDVIAPSMVLGQAIGRVGCFLNGCCFGGVCLTAPLGMTFPSDSPPYEQHQADGWRSGVWVDEQAGAMRIAYLAPEGAAAQSGLKVGDQPRSINGVRPQNLAEARALLASSSAAFEMETSAGGVHRWSSRQPPRRSVPIHATQLYAAIDAGLLALLLWAYYPYRRRDGEVFALLITLHPISRFVLELIRSDEGGQLGTGLTISQLLSLAILACACVLWWYVEERQPRGSALPLGSSLQP